jgi:hypothetical protein
LISIGALALPASALAEQYVIEAESMTWQPNAGQLYGPGYALQDQANPSVTGFRIVRNLGGSAAITTTHALSAVNVRLRSEQKSDSLIAPCQDSPKIVVKDGTKTLLTATVPPSTSYSRPTVDLGLPLSSTTVPAGAHTISIALTNDYDSTAFPCDRNVWVDKLTLVASQIFPDESWRNKPLADNAPLDPDQRDRDRLARQAAAYTTWVNTTDSFNVPVYTVPAGTATVPVTLDTRPGMNWKWTDQRDIDAFNAQMSAVPIPSNAVASGPTDCSSDGEWWGTWETRHCIGPWGWSDREIAIYQPSTDTLWELYHLVKSNGAWVATDGGRITNVSQSTQYDVQPFPSGRPHGVAATRIPLMATLPLMTEVKQYRINHPVMLHVPKVYGVGLEPSLQSPFRAPALASDGDFQTDDAILEGTRFRLPRSVNVDALGLPPFATAWAHAAQDYGIVVTDKDCHRDKDHPDADPCSSATAVTAFVEDPAQYNTDYAGYIGDNELRNFPWGMLQVVAPVAAGP